MYDNYCLYLARHEALNTLTDMLCKILNTVPGNKKTNIITFVEHVFSCQEIVDKLINTLNVCSFVMTKSGTENMFTE